MRLLYSILIRLHPFSFRERFAPEMFLNFDEATDSWDAPALIRDAFTSLFRQWLIRSEAWKWVIATIAGFLPLLLAFGSFLPWDRPMHH